MNETNSVTRFYLIASEDPSRDFVRRFQTASEAGDIAAVLFPAGVGDAHLQLVQESGAAAVCAADAWRAGMDGIHVDADPALLITRRKDHPEEIVGYGGASRRHEAMAAGENGADYVAFGRLLGRDPALPLERVKTLLSWWQPLVTVPCVARVTAVADGIDLAEAGADFLALDPALWMTDRVAEDIAALSAACHQP